MQSILINIAVALAIKLLKAYWEKENIKDAARVELYNEFLEVQLRADHWRLNAEHSNPDISRMLKVRPDAGKITIKRVTSDSPSTPDSV